MRLLAFCAAALAVAISAHASIISPIDVSTVGAVGTDGTAYYMQYSGPHGAGSGNLDSFVRIQANGTEAGYNTDAKPELDTKKGNFTHSLLLSAVPEVTMNGVAYREFLLDINQSNGGDKTLLSLDAVKIYIENRGDLSGYPRGFGTPIYDLGVNWVKLDDSLSSGSGQADMLMYVPSSLFGTDGSKYVYLYSGFGENISSNGGYEEWAVSTQGAVVPEPMTMALLAAGGLGMLRRRSL